MNLCKIPSTSRVKHICDVNLFPISGCTPKSRVSICCKYNNDAVEQMQCDCAEIVLDWKIVDNLLPIEYPNHEESHLHFNIMGETYDNFCVSITA